MRRTQSYHLRFPPVPFLFSLTGRSLNRVHYEEALAAHDPTHHYVFGSMTDMSRYRDYRDSELVSPPTAVFTDSSGVADHTHDLVFEDKK